MLRRCIEEGDVAKVNTIIMHNFFIKVFSLCNKTMNCVFIICIILSFVLASRIATAQDLHNKQTSRREKARGSKVQSSSLKRGNVAKGNRPSFDMMRGSRVEVIYSSNALTMTTQGIVLGNANFNDEVWVRLVKTGKVVKCILSQKGATIIQ